MSDLLSLCTRIACEAHAGQVDKAGEPYIFHVVRVAMAVEGEEAKAVALLHDVVEDSALGGADLCAMGVPRRIVEAVRALTRDKSAETYAEYIERCAANDLARRVKLADLADTPPPDRWSKDWVVTPLYAGAQMISPDNGSGENG